MVWVLWGGRVPVTDSPAHRNRREFGLALQGSCALLTIELDKPKVSASLIREYLKEIKSSVKELEAELNKFKATT